jgi:hypothetical protein
VTGMVAGRGGAVGATIARRAGGARARPCTQKAIDLAWELATEVPCWVCDAAAAGGRRPARRAGAGRTFCCRECGVRTCTPRAL